jgi:tetratricopeptide (TPR) repeat protein
MNDILRELGQAPHRSRFTLQSILSRRSLIVGVVAVATIALVLYLVGDRGFRSGQRDLRLGVLLFVSEAKDTAIAEFRPEIQRIFIKGLLGVRKITVDDRLHLNDAIKREFANDNPARTDDLFKFLRKSQYDYVIDGSITNSPQGGHTIQANLRKGDEFHSVEEFPGFIRAEFQLDSVVGALSKQILAYLRTRVLDIKPEMGIWNRNRPNNWAAVARLEDAYKFYCAGDRRAAITALREAVQMDSTFISPRIWLASYYKKYDPEEGMKNLHYLQSIKASVDDFGSAMIDWMRAFFEDNYGDQIRFLQKALTFDPRNRVLLENLAATYDEMHDTLGVLAAYKYCIETRWEYQPLYPKAVRYYLGERDYQAAREALLVWKDLDTVSVSPLMCGWLSAIALRTGDAAESEKWKDKFVIRYTDSAISVTKFALGGCYIDAGVLPEGESLLRSAVDLDQTNAEYRHQLAVALFAKGDTLAGLHELKGAAQLNPRAKTILLRLGNILREKGDIPGAQEQYQKYLLRDSTGYDAQQIRKWVRALHR